MSEAPPAASDAGVGTAPRISRADLSVQSAVPEGEIDDLVRRQLIPGPDPSGMFDRGNVSRLRLIKALETSGIAIDTLSKATAGTGLSFDFAGAIVADPVGLAPLTMAQASAKLAIDAETLQAMMLALGVAMPALDAPIREDDLEFLGILAKLREFGLPVPSIVGIVRAFGINMRRLAEAQRDLFRQQVEEPLLARGVPYHEMFAQAAAVRVPLQRLAYRVTFLLHRRFLEQLVYENLVTRFEEALEENAVTRTRRAVQQAICFVDISGFTERTENRGDRDAAAIGSTLVEIAQSEATVHRGSLVKPLGDGAMLRFAHAADAVRGALGVLNLARKRALPTARAAIALGPLIMQDGDYYGRTVNRAARLLGVAAPGQVLVTAAIAESVRDPRLSFTGLGTVRLRGVAEDVEAFVAAAA